MASTQRALLLVLLATGFAPSHSVSTSRLTCIDSLSTAQCQHLQATQGCTFVQPPGDTNFAGLVAHYCRATCGQCNVSETDSPSYALQDRVLRTLYDATKGPQWLENAGWLNQAVWHCCWRGVSCDATGNVTHLLLGWGLFGLQGSIPSELSSLSALAYLDLKSNSISGPVPEQLGSLSALAYLDLDENSISGSVPEQLGSLSALTRLNLYKNSISGSVPEQLGSLSALTGLGLDTNSISGSVPEQLGSLSALVYLDLHDNSISGLLPEQLGSLSALVYFDLQANSISGFVPEQLGSLSALTHLILYENSISGSVPEQLGSLSALTYLDLHDNRISGTLSPNLSLTMSNLRSLAFQINSLSGSLPEVSSTNLEVLLAHRNQFTGVVPSFEKLAHLKHLAIFSNNLKGHLSLPMNAEMISSVLAYSNRFSCTLGDNNATVEATQNLLLPGNAFGGQLPNWLMARDVPFLSVQSVWVQWRLVVLEAVVGTGLLLGTVWWITKGKLAEFFHFKPTVAAVRLQLVCSKILAGWTVATTTVLLPIYIAGANYFECGKPFLRSTMAYLSGNAAAEWSLSVAACLFVSMAVLSVEQIRVAALDIPDAMERHEATQGDRSIAKIALVVIGWVLCTATLSIPSLLYTAATSLPPDNTLGLGAATLHAFEAGGGAILYIVSANIVPVLSRAISHAVHGGARLSCNVIMATRLVISLIVPFSAVVMMNQDCFAQWLRLWNSCEDSSEEFQIVWVQEVGYCTNLTEVEAGACYSWSSDYVQTIALATLQ